MKLRALAGIAALALVVPAAKSPDPHPRYLSPTELAVSPDGSRLLFVAHRISHRPTHVWTIGPDGRDLTLIG